MTGKTFSHVFGTNIEPLERFIMKRDLMGPCWLDIRNATPSRRSFSWCKLEADVDDPKLIVKTDDAPASPPLVVHVYAFVLDTDEESVWLFFW